MTDKRRQIIGRQTASFCAFIYNQKVGSSTQLAVKKKLDKKISEIWNKSQNISKLIYHYVCPAKYRKVVFDKEVDETASM
jgi:hypothetical protein